MINLSNSSDEGLAMTSLTNEREQETERNGRRIRVQPGTLFIVFISGALFFLVCMTARSKPEMHKSPKVSFASSIREGSGSVSIDVSTRDTSVEVDDSSESSTIDLLIEHIEALIEEIRGDQSTDTPSSVPGPNETANEYNFSISSIDESGYDMIPAINETIEASIVPSPSVAPTPNSSGADIYSPTPMAYVDPHNFLFDPNPSIEIHETANSSTSYIAAVIETNETRTTSTVDVGSTSTNYMNINGPTAQPTVTDLSTISFNSSQGPTPNLSSTNNSIIPSPTATFMPNSFEGDSNSPSSSTDNLTLTPSNSPTFEQLSESPSSNTTACFTTKIYDSIDADIALLKLSISNNIERSHFLGGIVRLAAHDFMDFDRTSPQPYGPDGCFDPQHEANSGLPESVWCESCLLRVLHETKYSFLSRADFWIASAQLVIRQTSVNNSLDLKEVFTWGRVDRDSCENSGDRLPVPSRCSEVENVFLRRMGLEWRDAVALLGAHSLGRGSAAFSGHDGVWVDNADDAQVFDKQYYEELYLNAWRPRNNRGQQDWTTGDNDIDNPRMMLNTDLCLVYDIESVRNRCCSRTNIFNSDGRNKCRSSELARSRCPKYAQTSSRIGAVDAVGEFLGGPYPNQNNEPFYAAFTDAWVKATTLGWGSLKPLSESCD